ncbi:cupin domain-containing protein [Hymenobacter terrenus]|uniref:cupin domain-containing protein n=1 Tax=Hymenobacter terrenus TaxID=1629124 RepID=UPI0006199831|nr:cupin domain-containing protein [Hymenobacter terrenus]
MKPQGQLITREFYQRAESPVVHLPGTLAHHDVEQADAEFTAGRPTFFIVDVPAKTMCMTIGSLQPGQRSGSHRHSYETIMYITHGQGYTMIEDQRVDWQAGDAVYVPVWAWHHNVNLSPDTAARYVSCDNAPQLHHAGVAMFEPAQ